MKRTLFGRAALALALGGLLSSSAAFAYVIILKDGNRVTAKEKPTPRGKFWVFQTALGSPQQIAIEDIDLEKTDKYNQQGVGDSYLLEDAPGSRSIPQPTDKKPSLGEYIKQHKKTEIGVDPQPKKPLEMPTEAPRSSRPAQPGSTKAPETPAGVDSATGDAFGRAFDASNIKGAKLTQIPNGLKIVALADNEQQVFAALMATARGLKETRSGGRSLEKVELSLATGSNENAGKFLMTADDAEALLTGKTSAQRYFVASVIF